MRKLVAYELMSLDGVAEDPDAYFPDWDDAMDANLGTVIGSQDAVLRTLESHLDADVEKEQENKRNGLRLTQMLQPFRQGMC